MREDRSLCVSMRGFLRALRLGFFPRRGLLRGGTRGLLSFFFPFFFSLAKEEYNQSFVFRMLCNILERDIGVSRDLVKNKQKKQKNKTKRLIKSVQFLLFQIFLSLY